jgi:hypothetical protein
MLEIRKALMLANSAFIIDPSAMRWATLERAMLAYQSAVYPPPR